MHAACSRFHTAKIYCHVNYRVVEGASYNLPDAPAERAAREILSLVQEASDGELIVALVSGGGSSLLPVPERGIKLDEKRKVKQSLQF